MEQQAVEKDTNLASEDSKPNFTQESKTLRDTSNGLLAKFKLVKWSWASTSLQW